LYVERLTNLHFTTIVSHIP